MSIKKKKHRPLSNKKTKIIEKKDSLYEIRKNEKGEIKEDDLLHRKNPRSISLSSNSIYDDKDHIMYNINIHRNRINFSIKYKLSWPKVMNIINLETIKYNNLYNTSYKYVFEIKIVPKLCITSSKEGVFLANTYIMAICSKDKINIFYEFVDSNDNMDYRNEHILKINKKINLTKPIYIKNSIQCISGITHYYVKSNDETGIWIIWIDVYGFHKENVVLGDKYRKMTKEEKHDTMLYYLRIIPDVC